MVRTYNALLPGGRGSGLVRDGLRIGPKAGHFGCVRPTEAAGFAAGSRQFADKSAPTKNGSSRTNEASPGPLLHAIDIPTLVMHLQSE
ncbi:hypothetical protein BKM03_22305 [Pseudomonas avellanae]|uniref:Uncharacterized protein n=1 Tax=Pseudomonas avellanae TaxID=46257 RepID=A0AAD0M664_9PSED|nr:hypothetical protein BKM03_22305 [Pseudomonas avellanae]POP86505.1 hypothetical protein CXB34_12345 [Pseudomonas amygdali pv. morsprunorum]